MKQAQFNEALIAALGISLSATVAAEPGHDFQIAAPGQSFGVKIRVAIQSDAPVFITGVSLLASEPKWWTIFPAEIPLGPLSSAKPLEVTMRVTIAANAGYTQQPGPYPLVGTATLLYNNVPLKIDQVVRTKGQPLLIGPSRR